MVPSSLSVVTVLGLFVFIDFALPLALSLSLSPSCILYWRKCGWPTRERERERERAGREREERGMDQRVGEVGGMKGSSGKREEDKAGRIKGTRQTIWPKWQ